jgi:hypothetical protein
VVVVVERAGQAAGGLRVRVRDAAQVGVALAPAQTRVANLKTKMEKKKTIMAQNQNLPYHCYQALMQ